MTTLNQDSTVFPLNLSPSSPETSAGVTIKLTAVTLTVTLDGSQEVWGLANDALDRHGFLAVSSAEPSDPF